MPATQEMKSDIYAFETTATSQKLSSAVVVQLHDQPIEGGHNPVYGDVTWRTLISSDRTCAW
jgi:hypothetical protein